MGTRRELMDVVEHDAATVVKAMYRINLELGEAGAAVFSIVPMRKTLVPRFIQFVQDALDGLGLLGRIG